MRGSIDYNLRYRWREAPEEELLRIRNLCNIDEMIDLFAEGAKHRLQEGGRNLSLGQRHRLCLARALLGNPAILILDEIDANLDQRAAAVVDRVIDEFTGTVLMVTRAETRLSKADAIWHMQDGELIRIEQNDSREYEIGARS
jgi:ABC-type multidrug transport system fused ATPase/permease subunit